MCDLAKITQNGNEITKYSRTTNEQQFCSKPLQSLCSERYPDLEPRLTNNPQYINSHVMKTLFLKSFRGVMQAETKRRIFQHWMWPWHWTLINVQNSLQQPWGFKHYCKISSRVQLPIKYKLEILRDSLFIQRQKAYQRISLAPKGRETYYNSFNDLMPYTSLSGKILTIPLWRWTIISPKIWTSPSENFPTQNMPI